MKRLVLFDIGGVLLHLHIPDFFRKLSEYSPKARNIQEARWVFEKSGIENLHHDGILTEEAFLKKLMDLFNLKFSIKKMAQIYLDRLGSPIPEMIALKNRLAKEGTTVGLLSNTSRSDTTFLSAAYPEIYETFGGPKILSFEVGASKPSRKIYEAVPKWDNISFIEDTPRNLEIPKKLGWKTFVYPDESEGIFRLT